MDVEKAYIDLLNSTPYIKGVARNNAAIVRAESYIYSVTLPGINSGIIRTAIITTRGDSDFVIETLTAAFNASPNDNLLFVPNLTLQVQDLKTGKFFFSQPALFSLVSGGGGDPFIFMAPRVLPPNTSLKISVQNRVPATDFNQFFIAFQGTRLFYEAAQ